MTASLGLVAAAMLALQPAAAPPPPCLTPDEFTALARFMLPSLIEGAAAKCKADLPRDSFLLSESKGLARHYREAPKPDGALVDRAVTKLGLGEKLGLLATEDLGPVVEPALSELVIGRLRPKDCALVDGVVELMAPLPVEQLSLVVGLLGEVGQDEIGDVPIRLCRRGER